MSKEDNNNSTQQFMNQLLTLAKDKEGRKILSDLINSSESDTNQEVKEEPIPPTENPYQEKGTKKLPQRIKEEIIDVEERKRPYTRSEDDNLPPKKVIIDDDIEKEGNVNIYDLDSDLQTKYQRPIIRERPNEPQLAAREEEKVRSTGFIQSKESRKEEKRQIKEVRHAKEERWKDENMDSVNKVLRNTDNTNRAIAILGSTQLKQKDIASVLMQYRDAYSESDIMVVSNILKEFGKALITEVNKKITPIKDELIKMNTTMGNIDKTTKDTYDVALGNSRKLDWIWDKSINLHNAEIALLLGNRQAASKALGYAVEEMDFKQAYRLPENILQRMEEVLVEEVRETAEDTIKTDLYNMMNVISNILNENTELTTAQIYDIIVRDKTTSDLLNRINETNINLSFSGNPNQFFEDMVRQVRIQLPNSLRNTKRNMDLTEMLQKYSKDQVFLNWLGPNISQINIGTIESAVREYKKSQIPQFIQFVMSTYQNYLNNNLIAQGPAEFIKTAVENEDLNEDIFQKTTIDGQNTPAQIMNNMYNEHLRLVESRQKSNVINLWKGVIPLKK